jgi:NTP pyrophosphatase (non-canonical NTP hydrolase)
VKSNGEFSIGSKVWTGTSKLIEELGELQQVLGKLIGSHGEIAHYDGSDLEVRLVEEIADVQAAIAFFVRHNLDTNGARVTMLGRTAEKLERFEQWHKEGK